MLGFVASVIEGNVLAICDCSLFKIVSYINLFAWLGFSLTHLYNISKSLCLQFLILRQCTTVFYIYFLTPERSFSGKQVGPRHTSCPSSTLHSGDNMTVCEADPGRWIPPSDYLMLLNSGTTRNKGIRTTTWRHCVGLFWPVFPSYNLCVRWTEESLNLNSWLYKWFYLKKEVWTDKQDSILM